MTLRDQHLTVLPDRFHCDYWERCAINRGDGPITDEVRGQAFKEVLGIIERHRRKLNEKKENRGQT